MSFHTMRQDIALALRGVPGVTGYAFRPSPPKAGDAWPLLGPLERGPGLAFQATWRVMVYLPQSEREASKWIDEKYLLIVEALEPHGFVDLIEAVDLGTESNPIYGLQITMRGEG